MKKIITLLLFAAAFSFAGTPTIDGTFDGTGVWGSAVATADGVAGWGGVNVNQVYVTYDATYAYFAATFNTAPGGWQYVAFAINVASGGGGGCPWGAPGQAFGHANLPDFVLIGRLNGAWAELRNWTGSAWGGGGTNVYPTDMNWSGDYSYVEGRVLLSTLGNLAGCDVQFYVGGDNSAQHGNFDSCPDDNIMLSWNSPTTISNYIGSVPLPIQLASFVGSFVESCAKLEWTTISEVNNYGFNVQRLNEASKNFETVGFVAGKGTTLEPQSYSYTDDQPGNSYRLEQIDNDGLKNYFGPILLNPNGVNDNAVPAVFKLNQNYPNPFNPTTNISFSLAKSGHTTLKVYNILGNEVATLFNGNGEAGKLYDVKFDASKLSTGMYIYKLKNGNNVEIHKLVLAK